MNDQCINCSIRGNIDKCRSTDCFHHESWYARKMDRALADATTRIAELEAERDRWKAECLLKQIDLGKPTQERSYCRGCSLPAENTSLRAAREIGVAEMPQRYTPTFWNMNFFMDDTDDGDYVTFAAWVEMHARRLETVAMCDQLKLENDKLRAALEPIREVAKEWLLFSIDVATADAAGRDWLISLRNRTQQIIEIMEAKDE